MVIMIFGVSNVGKTTTGKRLTERLNWPFYDLDEEIKARLQMTLEQFMQENPFAFGRSKIKGNILKEMVKEQKDNMVIAVSPIYYAKNFNPLVAMDHVFAVELQDSKDHIFERTVFSDENDRVYSDDDYKEEYKEYYLKSIHEDIIFAKTCHKAIGNKLFMNNRSVDEIVDDLIGLMQNKD